MIKVFRSIREIGALRIFLPRPRRRNQSGFSMVEMMIVVIVALVLAAMAIPGFMTTVRNLRTIGDVNDLADAVSLAKMRAAANFTLARLYVDLSDQTFHLEYWEKPDGTCTSGCWKTEGGIQPLSSNVTFGYGTLSSPPLNTQTAIGQAPPCLKNDLTSTYSNTACIVFNSRGIPIDSTQSPTSEDALYVTDGKSQVLGVTVSATGLIRTWQSELSSANWRRR
jgi:prepilin-type N-terminal cleavage/methylation domain-containing protein